MWDRMVGRIRDYEEGGVDLGALVADLRGLFVEADPHDAALRADFESYWAPIDGNTNCARKPGLLRALRTTKTSHAHSIASAIGSTAQFSPTRARITTSADLPISRRVVGRCG
jgi:hypothetical protein